MTDAEAWLKSNDAYLVAAIADIHARLRRASPPAQPVITQPVITDAPPAPPPVSIEETPVVTDRSWFRRLRLGHHDTAEARPGTAAALPRREPGTPPPARDGAPPAPGRTFVVDPSGRAVEHEPPAVTTEGPAAQPTGMSQEPPAAVRLQKMLGLTPFELQILLLCAAMELDTRTPGLCAQAQNGTHAYPTFALAMSLFDEPSWEALSPERPLRYWRLIDIAASEDQPLVCSALRADERIVNYLKGLQHLDNHLALYLAAVPIPARDGAAQDLSSEQLEQAAEIAARLRASGDAPMVVQLAGPASDAKTLIAAEAGRREGLALYRCAASALPTAPTELSSWIRLWQRETVLLPIGLVLDAGDSDDRVGSDGALPPVSRFLAQLDTLVFLLCREPWGHVGADSIVVPVARPAPGEQADAWTTALGADADARATAARLAGQYDLELAAIRRIAAQQRALGRTTLPDVWEACLAHSRSGLDLLAHRIVPRATWDDLVLPEETSRLLHEIADQVRNRLQVYDQWGFRTRMSRGLGISVLFDGETGTGKTMAAEVLARELRLDLYRIDLSAVVSKYIGETEKNLRRLFDAADNGAGILFFDEADSIFGKRSEVKDSHDRYANIEINYLLQRIEAYAGLAILATNMKSAVDQAFVRRLRFIVKFRFPGPSERKRIWAHVFPAETPVELDDPGERLDYDRLAKVNLTGGSISNAALNAAFRAAAAGTKVTLSQVTSSIQTELKKADRAAAQV